MFAFFRPKKRSVIDKRVLELLKTDNAAELEKVFDMAAVNTAFQTVEKYEQVKERTEMSILLKEQKSLLALAMDNECPNVIRLIGAATQDVSRIYMRDVTTVQGLLTEKEFRQTGFRSAQHLEFGLEDYFDMWVKGLQRILISTNLREKPRKTACERTIQAIKETFGGNLNEFR